MKKEVTMKKVSFKIVLVSSIFSILFATNVFGGGLLSPNQEQDQTQGQLQAQGQLQGQGQVQNSNNSNKNTNTNANLNANSNNNTLNNKILNSVNNDIANKNVGINKIESGAVKNTNDVKNANSNNQSQSTNNNQTISPNQSVSITEVRQSLAAPNLEAFYMVPLQNGKYGDYTKSMPRYQNSCLVPLQGTDEVVNIIDVYFGYPFNRITFEEIEKYTLDKSKGIDCSKGNIRYSVRFQESVITTGSGGSTGIADTSNSGLTSWSSGVMPSISKSTANPIFIITFYEVK